MQSNETEKKYPAQQVSKNILADQKPPTLNPTKA